MSTVEIRGISKSYGSVRAVEGIDLTAATASRTAIVGPSGSGKTTLLRLIAGFEQPDSGSILLDGQLLADGTGTIPAHLRRIGYLAQDGGLFPHLTVAGNIGFGLSGPAKRKSRRVVDLMTMVALDPALGSRWPHQLSGGQQQRVALARALARRPRLMLLDEPFSALDTGLRASTRKTVADLLQRIGTTTILVTHDQSEALSFAHQVAVIRDGRLAQVGTGAELYWHPRDGQTALFLGDAIIVPAQLTRGIADCALGRVAVNDTAYEGAAYVMFRPEQLQIEEAAPGSQGTPLWHVTDVEFGGSSVLVTVRLQKAKLTLRCPSIRIPPIGACIKIVATGQAHRLPADCSASFTTSDDMTLAPVTTFPRPNAQ